MKKYVLLALLSSTYALRLDTCKIDDLNLKYPVLPRGSDSGNYPGVGFSTVSVNEPYRLLEDPENPKTKQWIKQENELTDNYMKKLPGLDKLANAVSKNQQYTKFELPSRHGNELYVITKEGKKGSHELMYKMKDKQDYHFNPYKPEEKAELALDISKLGAEDEDTERESFRFSKDGKYMAFEATLNGSDWKKIRVVNLKTGKETEDVIEKVKFSSASWDINSKGFFYGRYDSTEKKQLKYVGSDPQELPHQSVYYHKIGTPQDQDKLIYEDPSNPEQSYSISKTNDGQYLKMTITKGTDP